MAVQSGANLERTSTSEIDRGLYVVRYIGSDANKAPLVHLRPSFGSDGAIRFVLHPDLQTPVLSKPGDALVLQVDKRAGLQITIQSRDGGSLDANLRVEPIHGAVTQPQPAAAQLRPAPQPLPATTSHRDAGSDAGFELVGHLARRGDVSAAMGAWIGGPDAPAPIEGVGLIPKDGGSAVEYQVLVQGTEQWSEWTPSGRYAGTRGRGQPLAGVRFRLTGPDADRVRLKGAALFLGSAVVSKTGPGLEFRSVAGQDPLVGLMLGVEAPDRVLPARPAEEMSRQAPERKGRVRVFRAGVEQKFDGQRDR